MKNLTKAKNNRTNKIENLTLSCTLGINKKTKYSTKQINEIIDFYLKGFKLAKNEIKLTIDEYLVLFINIRNYSIDR